VTRPADEHNYDNNEYDDRNFFSFVSDPPSLLWQSRWPVVAIQTTPPAGCSGINVGPPWWTSYQPGCPSSSAPQLNWLEVACRYVPRQAPSGTHGQVSPYSGPWRGNMCNDIIEIHHHPPAGSACRVANPSSADGVEGPAAPRGAGSPPVMASCAPRLRPFPPMTQSARGDPVAKPPNDWCLQRPLTAPAKGHTGRLRCTRPAHRHSAYLVYERRGSRTPVVRPICVDTTRRGAIVSPSARSAKPGDGKHKGVLLGGGCRGPGKGPPPRPPGRTLPGRRPVYLPAASGLVLYTDGPDRPGGNPSRRHVAPTDFPRTTVPRLFCLHQAVRLVCARRRRVSSAHARARRAGCPGNNQTHTIVHAYNGHPFRIRTFPF